MPPNTFLACKAWKDLGQHVKADICEPCLSKDYSECDGGRPCAPCQMDGLLCGGPLSADDDIDLIPQDFWLMFYGPGMPTAKDGRPDDTRLVVTKKFLWNAKAEAKLPSLWRGLLHLFLLPHTVLVKHTMGDQVYDVDMSPGQLFTLTMNNWLAAQQNLRGKS